MWNFIKQKSTTLGCFVFIAIMAVAATAITKVVLGWFDHDDASTEILSKQVGGYVVKGLLALVVSIGFIMMARQLVSELRGKAGSEQSGQSTPPPLPHQHESGSQTRSNHRDS